MTRNDLTRIICSQDLNQAYCVVGSGYYKKMMENNELDGKTIVHIPHYRFSQLVLASFEDNKFKWNMEKILEYSVENN